MASTYPGILDDFTNPSGTTITSDLDHALQHSNINDAVENIQGVLGTTAGTSVVKDFASGDFATRINSSGVLQQAIEGTATITSGTINNIVMGTPAVTGGTINAVTLGTPIINNFTSSGTATSTKADRGLAPTVVTLTDVPSGTITPNAAAGQVFHMILGTTAGNRTFAVPDNPTEGQAINFRIKQNTNNTGTIVFNAIYRMNDGGTMTLGTESTYNYAGFRFNTVDTKWDDQGNSVGII